ncbi:MAG: sugar phosphate isomerase/epimerase [Gemmatimonadaceae bacterium]
MNSPGIPSGPDTRRAFVGALLRAAAALAAGGLTAGAKCARREAEAGGTALLPAGTRAIGVQLYTVRDLMARDLPGTLAALAAIGYTEVEFAGYFGQEPAQLRALLARLGLAAPGVHQPLDALRNTLDAVLAAAEIIEHRYIVCPWLAESERTADGYRRLAADLDRIGRACRDRGFQLGYHNHDFEFDPGVFPGTTPYDVLLAETDPELVTMELDLFWITRGGRDPLWYFEHHPGRFPLWHVKDMRDVAGAREMVSVGQGDIDFGRLFAAGERAGLKHFFVEHDNPADSLASVRASYEHLRRILR